MEQLKALKQSESTLSLVSDHVSVLAGKLEDLLFRAQRIAHAMKEKAPVTDSMFGYDLQTFRRDVRAFTNELGGISGILASIERGAQFDEQSLTHAQAVMRLAERVHKSLQSLHDQSLLAHQHIRSAEHKVEAWYLVQEVDATAQQVQGLPGIANKVVVKVSTPPRPGSVPAGLAAAPAAPPRPQAPAQTPAARPIPPAQTLPRPAAPSQPAAPTPMPAASPRKVVPLRPAGRPNVLPPSPNPLGGQPGPDPAA